MASIVLDTNIVIDYLSSTRPCHQEAVDLLTAVVESDDLDAVIPAASLKDIYYVLCRQYHSEGVIRQRLDDLRAVVDVEDLTTSILDTAFASDEPDFEDGIVRATAETVGAVAIITRDKDAYARSSVPAMPALAFTHSLG